MTTMTPEDAIKAASSVARDIADGTLSPTDLEGQAVAELRALVGEVVGPDDPAWSLQCDIARQVLALDGVPADELAEWLGVESGTTGGLLLGGHADVGDDGASGRGLGTAAGAGRGHAHIL
ncbi:flagellar hook-length control protein [Mycobacterium avium]|uniref:flagellar hook-length control protein n=1 Tax=Mycobacterium avium TaxID=1764 RepID=UPI001F360765|nr:flagellar hook-length control protein [Mycobacterium avium]